MVTITSCLAAFSASASRTWCVLLLGERARVAALALGVGNEVEFERAAAERGDLLPGGAADVKAGDDRAQALCGGDGLQAGDAGAEDEDLGRRDGARRRWSSSRRSGPTRGRRSASPRSRRRRPGRRARPSPGRGWCAGSPPSRSWSHPAAASALLVSAEVQGARWPIRTWLGVEPADLLDRGDGRRAGRRRRAQHCSAAPTSAPASAYWESG